MQQITSRQLRAGAAGDTRVGNRVPDYSGHGVVVRAVRASDGAGERVQEPQVLQQLLLRPQQPQGDWPSRRVRVRRESFGE